MSSTTSVQTRISAFESLASNPKPPPSPSPSPPNLGRKTSLIDLNDWVLDDSVTPDSSKTPTQQIFARNRNPNPPLISLESPPKPKPNPKPARLVLGTAAPKLPPRKPSSTFNSVASSSSSPPADSLTVDYAHRYPPLTSLALEQGRNSTSGHAPSSSISSFHSVSLSSDTDPSTPGSITNFIATYPVDEEHGRPTDTDSISLSESYEEVSTSSLASPSAERLINLDWEKAMAKHKSVPPTVPPRLPQRPGSARAAFKATPPPSHPVSRTASASGSTPTSPTIYPASSSIASTSSLTLGANGNPPYTPRRAAPPPPPSRSSDRSSIRSNTSYSSSTQSTQSRSVHHTPSLLSLKSKRPTPVPLAARKRYETIFNNNIIQRRKAEKRKLEDKPPLLSPTEARGKRTVGWRGLSVDLITGDEFSSPINDKVDEVVGSDEKLEGEIVKVIWKRSKLSNAQLADIWNECDITGRGALSLEAFVKGMWRIDEELRRAEAQAIRSATSGAATYRSNSLRPMPKAPHKPRDILR